MPQPPYQENTKAAQILHQPGLAKVTYPNDDRAYPLVTRELTVDRADKELAFLTPDTEYPNCLLIAQPIIAQDHALVRVVRTFERIPGPQILTSRIDPEDGAVINEVKQLILKSSAAVSTSGPVVNRYEPRGDSDLVTWQYTTTTDLTNVVRSYPARIALHLPKVLAGCAVTYNDTGEDGADVSSGGAATTLSTYSLHATSSARSSGSASVIPEPYLPIREEQDDNVPAVVKQVYLYGAATEAALCAHLTSVYEVAVTGTLSPNLTLTPLAGNSSDRHGAVWFSNASYELAWDGTVWKMGTPAGVLAGNYWTRTAGATGWLGAYTPTGSVTGTATVVVGRTVNPPIVWNTQEVTLTTAGKHVSVSSNASCSDEVRVEIGGVAQSIVSGHGFSIASGGQVSRVRIDPTIHGQIVIANPTYTRTVNATAAAGISATGGFTGVSASSGIGADSHAQTVQSYVRVSAGPLSSTPSAKTISGNTVASALRTITGITAANPAVVTTSAAHGFSTGDVVTIAGTDSTPVIDGSRVVTMLTTTTFSVAVNVTVLGTTGTARRPTVVTTTTPHGLATGDTPVITGSNSTPSINGSALPVTYLSATTFSYPVMVTVAGTAGSVQGPTTYNAIAIPATDPVDIPRSGLYLDPSYGKTPHDATSIQFLAPVVDYTYFAKKPASIEYSDPQPKYRQGIAIIPNQPIFLGGAPTSYAISPSFSGGLSFDMTTGIISGTSSIGLAPTLYTVTGTNASGSAVATVLISVSA